MNPDGTGNTAALNVPALCTLCLLLAGCAGPPGTHVWWNPSTWGRDRAAALQQTEARQSANQDKLNVEALRETFKTKTALAAAPQDNRAVAVAVHTNENAYSLLTLANGPLDLGQMQEDRATVAGLLSDNAELRAAAERSQAKAESAQARLSRENAALAKEHEADTAKIAEGYARERKLANTVRNFWFIVGGLAALFILGNVLRVAAPFVPALAGISKVIGAVVNPAAEFALHRAQSGLQNVGRAMAAVRDQLAPELAQKIVTIFDTHTDADQQRVIGVAANTAPRT